MKIHKRLFCIDVLNSEDRPFVKLTPYQKRKVKEFNDKVKNGITQFKYNKCLCGNDNFDLLSSKDRYSFIQQTVICRQCGLVMSNPTMTDEAYSEFYTDDTYRMCYDGEDFMEQNLLRYDEGCALHIFSEINRLKTVDSTVSCLEIGAGGGWNLLPFMKAGAHVLGLDYSQGLVQLGRDKGINMKQGSIKDIEGLFDVIILNHVLEHFSDPFGVLRKISAHLKKDGFFYIAVPNINNYDMGELQNAHIYYFNPDTFKYFSTQNSFEILSIGSVQDMHMFGILRPSENIKSMPSLKNNYISMMSIIRRRTLTHYVLFVLSRLHLNNAVRLIYRSIAGK